MKIKTTSLINKLLHGTYDHYFSSLPEKTGFLSGLILKLFFSRVRINQAQSSYLKQLHKKGGIIIFANKHKSLFDFLFYHTRYRQLGLPYPYFGFYYKIFLWQPISKVFRVGFSHLIYFFTRFKALNPFERGYFKTQLLEGKSGFLSLMERKRIYYKFIRNRANPVERLIDIAKETDRPIHIVPQIIFFSNKPLKSSPTLMDILFGSEENPGKLRRIIALLRHPKKIFVEIADPVNLNDFLANESIIGLGTKQQAILLKKHLMEHINLHRQSILGPVLKSRMEIIENIITHSRIQDHIRALSEKEKTPVRQIEKNVGSYLDEIAANYSLNWIKAYDVSLRVILKMLFEGMSIDKEGLRKAKEMSKKGPLILVPCHKSHLDYLILSFIFYHNHMPCPHIAAGKNLSFWPFGTIFRGGGAFFMRRTFKGQPLYAKVFSEYIFEILSQGFNVEFFIEGTRSRTGKLLMPKLGILSIILDAFMNKAVNDLVFVPISIGYDRVIEEKSYIHEIEGGSKEPESLKNVIKARKTLKKRYGKVYVNFSNPLSLRDYLSKNKLDLDSMTAQEKRTFCTSLGFRFINSINQKSVVTPYGIVASSILNNNRKRVSSEMIESCFHTYMKYLKSTGARLADTLAQEEDLALSQVMDTFLSQKIIEQASGEKHSELEPGRKLFKINPNKRPSLDYYKNNCIIFFVPSAFIALAIMELDSFNFKASDLHTSFRFLRRLFSNEFAYDPNKEPEFFVRKSLKAFIDDSIIIPHQTKPDTYLLTSSGLRKLKLFAGFLQTFFESYIIVLNFYLRYPSGSISQKSRLKKIQTMGIRMHKRKEIQWAEALSKVSYINGDKFFLSQGLSDPNAKDKIDFYMEKINKYLELIQS